MPEAHRGRCCYWNLWSGAPGDYSLYESNFAGDYPIAISGGNMDPTAVPEPSTWVMMLVGLMGIGSAAYRRSRKDRFAPTFIQLLSALIPRKGPPGAFRA